jgi:hypothetical protein
MSQRQSLTQYVDSYRFWDVVTLWARERLEHEQIVSRVLAQGFVRDGLRIQSIDTKWQKGDDHSFEFKGYPYVGYCSKPHMPMCVLRAEALSHLLAIVQRAEPPNRELLHEEFILRGDFENWAREKGIELPSFWFAAA